MSQACLDQGFQCNAYDLLITLSHFPKLKCDCKLISVFFINEANECA